MLCLLSLVPAWGLVALLQAPPAPTTLRAEVEELFRTRCMACHVAPDPRFAADRTWIAQVASTSCAKTPPALRSALVEYLESKPLPLPEVVDGSVTPKAGQATLLPSFKRGAAVLRAPDGRLVRLSWDEPGGDRRRGLAPGIYELLGYHLVAEGAGATWQVSGSGLQGITLGLSPGGSHALALNPSIRLEERVQSDGLQVLLQGHEEAGVSLYKEGKRVPLRYRRVDPAGQVLGEGELAYTSGGGGAARFEPLAGEYTLEVLLETSPFPTRRVRK